MNKRKMQFVPVSASTATRFLLWIAGALAVTHAIVMVLWFTDVLPVDRWLYIAIFDLDEEESIGTWFSTLLLFVAGLLTILTGRLAAPDGGRWARSWSLLGAGFILLSIDEVAGFHETVNTLVKSVHWTAFGAAVVGLSALIFVPFLRSLPARTRRLFLIAGAVYVGGAVGVEAATLYHEQNDLLNTLGYNLWTAVEEFMEMAGVILFVRALLSHIEVELGGAAVWLELGSQPAGADADAPSGAEHTLRAVPDGSAAEQRSPAA